MEDEKPRRVIHVNASFLPKGVTIEQLNAAKAQIAFEEARERRRMERRMNRAKSQDDILQALLQKHPEISQESLETLLLNLLLNPVQAKIQRSRLVESSLFESVSETREGIFVGPNGVMQELHETVHNVQTLDDGTTLNSYGACRCQTCNGLVKTESIRRCPCGKTCCVRPKCGRQNIAGDWYCCKWHRFAHSLLGMRLR